MTSTGPQRTAVVVNPVKVPDLDELRRTITDALTAEGWPEPMWLETTVDDPGAGQATRAVRDGAELVLACGGDGTVMACVTALAGSDVALAVLPAGTGNLLAANLGLAGDLATGLEVVLQGGRRRIDVGAVGRQSFAVMAGFCRANNYASACQIRESSAAITASGCSAPSTRIRSATTCSSRLIASPVRPVCQ